MLADRSLTNGYTLGLAAGLRACGVTVRIGGPALSGVEHAIPIYQRSGVPGRYARKAGDLTHGVGALGRAVLTTRPHVLHFQWPTRADVAYAMLARRLFRVPIAYTVHNPCQRANESDHHDARQRTMIGVADLVLAHGHASRELILEKHPGAVQKVHVVEHGSYEHQITRYPRAAARARLRVPADEPLFVFVGQLRPRKAVDVLLTAFSEYRNQGGNGRLLIVGTVTAADYHRRLQETAAALGSLVRWRVSREPVSQETVDLAVSAATQVVLPFHEASQSGSVILAMTHGRCVVTTRTGEVARTVAGRGMLFAPGDRIALLDAMRQADDNAGLCDALGKKAREYALTQLSWTRIASTTSRLYRSVIERACAR